jgi:sugar lactone lactonase YvrE
MDAQVMIEGLHFGEGPRWHDGALWFSDFYDHAVKRVSIGHDDGLGVAAAAVVAEMDDQPSGLGWLPDGSLLAVAMQTRQVRRYDGSEWTVHADLSEVATFHCNDMVVDADGRAYVGNFGFDLFEAMTSGNPQPFDTYPKATMAIIEPDGTVRRGPDELMFPNGSVITPDGGTLIVAETLGGRLTAFDRASDGTLSNRRVWADLPGRAPDGICLDAEGAVWVADALAIACVRVAEGGAILDTVTPSQSAYACALGGDDGQTLFVLTAASSAPQIVASTRTGRIETAHVTVPAA